MSEDAESKEDFKEWWDLVGSGLCPLPGEDQEEHAQRVAFRAFLHAQDIYS